MNDTEITIHAFEEQLEAATEHILARAGIDAAFLAGRPDGEALPESRVELMFTLGPAADDGLDHAGRVVPTGYEGILEVGVNTRREQEQTSMLAGVRTLHAEFAARLRVALLARDCPYDGLVPYRILAIKPEQNDRNFDETFFEDYTRLRWRLRLQIPRAAWVAA